ncbi:MAG: CotH kinase family protein [Bacteroidaceae bacterium]|nr:CotH kinase family protein [Bacteroidaceae bacterium]
MRKRPTPNPSHQGRELCSSRGDVFRLFSPLPHGKGWGRASFSFFLLAFLSLLCPAFGADYVQLTNLPTLYVETFNGRSITTRSAYVLCRLTYVEDDETIVYDSVEIRGRGNSTWSLAKKPYRIRFPEAIRFLGKGRAKARSWTLLANHADKTLIHNALASEVGTFVGQPFTAASLFVDFVLNGTYMGNYQISDQVNVDKRRVNIVEQEEPATEESNITGGYYIELGGFATSDPVWFRTSRGVPISIKSPDETVINSAQKGYIRSYLNDYESRLFSSEYRDPESGYRAVTDSTTLVSWYIATEVTANPDGLWSTYAYKNQDDPQLYWGPLWDFDIAFNNCNRIGDVTNRFMTDAGFGNENAGMWVKRMIRDPWFNWAVNKGWQRFVADGIEEHLLDYVDSLAMLLNESQQLNYQKYRIDQRVYNEIYLFSTYQEYIDDLKKWISNHIQFLSQGFASRVTGEEPLDPFRATEGWYYRVTNRGTGMSVDIDAPSAGAGVMMWQTDATRESQHWVIRRVDEYYQFVNRTGNLALTDLSPNSDTGTQLSVAPVDATDERQLWNIVTVNQNGIYNLINVATRHAANNQGGGTDNSNPIISYTNDERNATSNNRQWHITKEEQIPDYIHEEVRANFADALAAAEAFLSSLTPDQVGLRGGLYPEVEVATLRTVYADALALDSRVEDDYIAMTVRLRAALTRASTPNPITKIQQQLADLQAEGDSILQAIQTEWIGDEPFMYSREAYEALRSLLAEIEHVEPYYNDADAHPYVDSLAVLNDRAATLNIPDENAGYYLVNASGYYLNASESLLFADTLICITPTVWRFSHVNRTPNAYYLSCSDGYLFVKAGGNGMLGLNPTRRALYGKFYFNPNGIGTFTITSLYGSLGADTPIADGSPVIGASTVPSTTTWMLRRADDDNAFAPIPYAPLNYVVKLDIERRIIRFETADDPDRLADIPVHIYTTGGRLLYTFSASEPQSVADLSSGTYILTWTTPEGQTKTIHFRLFKP